MLYWLFAFLAATVVTSFIGATVLGAIKGVVL